MASESGNEEATSSTAFIPLRRPQQSRSRAPRPHSTGALIISNPKLVKGWTYYDNSPNQKCIQKYFSSVNLPHGPGPINNRRSIRHSGFDGEDETSRSRPVINEDGDDTDEVVGVEIKACVATEDDYDDEENIKCCYQYLGIVLTLLASSALALSAVLVKCLPKEYHPYSVSVWTFQGILFPSLIVYLVSCSIARRRRRNNEELRLDYLIKRESSNLRKRSIRGGLILVRGVLGWAGVVLKLYSLHFMSVADSTIITFTSPVFVTIAAWICLKEKVGIVPVVTAVVVLLGVGIITRPPMLTGELEFDEDQLTGCALAAGCMLFGVFVIIILRYIRSVHFALINFVYGLIGTAGSLILCYVHGELQIPESNHDWLLAASIAALTFTGQILMTLALRFETASVFAVVRTWEIPVTFLWQFIFLGLHPDWLSLTGAGLVVLGVLVLTFRKWIAGQPESRKVRRLFRFLLL